MTKINIWKNDITSYFDETFGEIYSYERFSILEVNNDLNVSVKIASLIAAPAVVSIRVYSGEKVESVGSGIIVKCNDQFEATVLTSGTLFRAQPTQDYNLKVIVVLQNQVEYEGKVEACDLHFNLALIKIQGERMLQAAKFRHIYDSIPIGPTHVHLQPLNDLSIIAPGDILIALGPYHKGMGEIMVAPGEFRKCRRPWIGLQLFNLFNEELCILENIFKEFPDIVQGVIVDEVIPNSPAKSAGIESKDIIVRCDGQLVKDCLHFLDLIWDKIDKSINLDIARFNGSHRKLSVMVAELELSNIWPLPIRDD